MNHPLLPTLHWEHLFSGHLNELSQFVLWTYDTIFCLLSALFLAASLLIHLEQLINICLFYFTDTSLNRKRRRSDEANPWEDHVRKIRDKISLTGKFQTSRRSLWKSWRRPRRFRRHDGELHRPVQRRSFRAGRARGFRRLRGPRHRTQRRKRCRSVCRHDGSSRRSAIRAGLRSDAAAAQRLQRPGLRWTVPGFDSRRRPARTTLLQWTWRASSRLSRCSGVQHPNGWLSQRPHQLTNDGWNGSRSKFVSRLPATEWNVRNGPDDGSRWRSGGLGSECLRDAAAAVPARRWNAKRASADEPCVPPTSP